jgi:hypothetical protein
VGGVGGVLDAGAVCGTDGVVGATQGAVEVDEECNKELTKGWVSGPSEDAVGSPAVAGTGDGGGTVRPLAPW